MAVYRCDNCGHGSIVKSNFKGISSGKFFCNSDKRPECEVARSYFVKDAKVEAAPSYAPITGWR